MASQINITPQQVPSSATQDKLKSLRSLDEGKSSGVTVRVTRKWEELDFMSTNDVTSTNSLRSLDEGKSSGVTVRVTKKWEELDFMSTNDVTSVDMVIVDEQVLTTPCFCKFAIHDKLKSLRSLDEGKSSGVTVRVTKKWEELDFMSTNDVTSVDMVIVDEQGDELHAIIPKNLTWKFDKQIREGGICGWLLKDLTNIQVLQRASGQSSRMREIMIENGRYYHVLTSLSLSSYNPFVGNDPIDCDSTPCPVLVAVRSTFVKNYQGKITLSSTNATKIYNNVDLKSSKCMPLCAPTPSYYGAD
ncbi:hypothetical protein C5167_015228 [Papaver somniferum]|uniref:Replication protein A 70 kDa DNA-binding subunit B/D first OB fold domain-containing protein n=1 Tax=Papaver somniferum TaxID=3469 RepID=A0A4Y7J5F1_PAPSO|nr:hypothetical protein C5167_015228 [Papaver somniferum]